VLTPSLQNSNSLFLDVSGSQPKTRTTGQKEEPHNDLQDVISEESEQKPKQKSKIDNKSKGQEPILNSKPKPQILVE
jgi:beta-lactamase regulating signal transducer with metallopeptidase domain